MYNKLHELDEIKGNPTFQKIIRVYTTNNSGNINDIFNLSNQLEWIKKHEKEKILRKFGEDKWFKLMESFTNRIKDEFNILKFIGFREKEFETLIKLTHRKKNNLQTNTILFRGQNKWHAPPKLEVGTKGNTSEWSTSLSQEVAKTFMNKGKNTQGKILIEIHAKKGTKGIPFFNLSKNTNELEYVLAHAQEYIIKSVEVLEDGSKHVIIELL